MKGRSKSQNKRECQPMINSYLHRERISKSIIFAPLKKSERKDEEY
jgi:hypothetical protein